MTDTRSLHVVVIANGELRYPQRLQMIVDQADRIIAADGGANWLVTQGRLPDMVVGDMDSVAPDVLRALEEGRCRLLRHRRAKDETDTELALLEAMALGAGRITLLGALGGRVDHALANILLLTMPQLAGVAFTLFDGCSYLSLIEQERIIRGQPGDIVSLLPLGGDARGVATEGLEYPLRGETLYLGPARGVSNVLVGQEARVRLEGGKLLLVHTPLAWLEETT